MQPESNRIEHKATLNDKLERSVVAFLNYHEGGLIYIGINDKGKPVGVANIDDVQLKIVSRIANNILPNALGLFDVVLERYDGKDVIKLIVAAGTEKPYYIKKFGMSPMGCFLRVGSSAQPMAQQQIDMLYAGRLRRVTLGNTLSPRQHLTFTQLKIYYAGAGFDVGERFVENLDLLTTDGKFNYAAYMLADENGVSIKVATYAGIDKLELIENEEFGYCSLLKATHQVLDKLRVENRTFAKITAIKRLEHQMVNAAALREAVINAIIHNDYSREVPPVVEIYSDRMTITSYGGLVDGLTREDFFACRSIPRNRELMRIFKDAGLVEQLGSGMKKILHVYNESHFEFTPNFMVVTLPFDKDYLEQFPATPGVVRNVQRNDQRNVQRNSADGAGSKGDVSIDVPRNVPRNADNVPRNYDNVLRNDQRNADNDQIKWDNVLRNDQSNADNDQRNADNDQRKWDNDQRNDQRNADNGVIDEDNVVIGIIMAAAKNELHELILRAIKRNKKVTIPLLSAMLLHSPKSVHRELTKLKEQNRIIRVGSTKSGHWEIVE